MPSCSTVFSSASSSDKFCWKHTHTIRNMWNLTCVLRCVRLLWLYMCARVCVCTHLVLDLPQPHVFTADLEMCCQKLIHLLQCMLAAKRCCVRYVAPRRRRRRRTNCHARRTCHRRLRCSFMQRLNTLCGLAPSYYMPKALLATVQWLSNPKTTVSK